ncbi:hypothetical protein RIF29_21209 [Crotalaria pallida]|uniref:Uncharacterized protein n=1 Tax=Crotalaria pallida TaxID=3830 RepID=A0AAN9I871_CROPI
MPIPTYCSSYRNHGESSIITRARNFDLNARPVYGPEALNEKMSMSIGKYYSSNKNDSQSSIRTLTRDFHLNASPCPRLANICLLFRSIGPAFFLPNKRKNKTPGHGSHGLMKKFLSMKPEA